jgi:hypothetical protein
MIRFNAHFDGKVLTPDEQVTLPIGTPLRVTIEETPEPAESVDWLALLQAASECSFEGPEDLADHHDQYAHWKPLR